MGYGTDGLTFSSLRGANVARLPEFKNKHGNAAHTKSDGSDWSPAQWFQAVLGELGEFAQVRIAFEQGRIQYDEYKAKAAKELADIVIYLDILALRSLDDTRGIGNTAPAQSLMNFVAELGAWANERKKHERGDIDENQYGRLQRESFSKLDDLFSALNYAATFPKKEQLSIPGSGINLGQATMDKFNEVSVRVGSRVRLEANDWHYITPIVEEALKKPTTGEIIRDEINRG